MSITVQQILLDAKKLVCRLKDHDNSADSLISQAQSLQKQVDAMKQYEDDVEELNEVARQKPRSLLIQGIQQENRHIRELQQENRELRNALEEHQNAMELIMSKYREHMVSLLRTNNAIKGCGHADNSQFLILKQTERINEMAAVMNKAALLDEEQFCKDRERLVQLNNENKGLREMLDISAKIGSTIKLSSVDTVDKEIQTDSKDKTPNSS